MAPLDKKKYNDFINAVELEDVSLSYLKATKSTGQIKNKVNVNLSPKFKLVQKDSGSFIAQAEFNIVVKDHGDNTIFAIVARYLLTYSFAKEFELTNEIINCFINTNVPLNSWPYGRELISSITTRMGYPPLVIKALKCYR